MVLEWVSRAIGGFLWLLGRIIFGPPKKKPKDHDDKRRRQQQQQQRDDRRPPDRLEDKENVAPHSTGIEKPSVPIETVAKELDTSQEVTDHGLTNGMPEPDRPRSALEEPLREIQNEIDATFKDSLAAMGMSTTPPPPPTPTPEETTTTYESAPEGVSSERTFSHQETSYSSQTATSFVSSTTASQQQQQSFVVEAPPPVIPVAPPPPSLNDKQRPFSMPSLDFNILEAIERNKITLVGGEKKTTTTTTTKQTVSHTTSLPKTKDGHGHTISATDEESRRFQMLMKAFQPPPDDEAMITQRRGKMFSSSSFYDEPKHIYPTVQEQVKMCKTIADSLSADSNKQSRGATMYIKRMNRSTTWIHEGPDPTSSESDGRDADSSEYEPTTPEAKGFDFKPHLKLVLDPRQLQDAMKLSKTGIYNEHNVVSPDICFDLVRDLNSPTGKGAQLFAKRKKKSEKWIVDEDSVKEAVKEAAAKYVAMADVMNQSQQQQQLPTTPFGNTMPTAPRNVPVSQLKELQERLNPKVKLIKSPWEVAMQSPSGCVDAAFEMVKQKTAPKPSPLASMPVAPSPPPLSVNVGGTNVPQHADMRLYSPRPFSPVAGAGPFPVQQTARSNSPYYSASSSIYKPKAPKGWIGNAYDQSASVSSWGGQESPCLMDTSFSSDFQEQQQQQSSFQRYNLDTFPNYNNVARAWGQSKSAVKGFRPVRPSSAVYGQ